jgi:hypothetical protein
MTERTFTIEQDGVYEAPDSSRFQYRKGHVLGMEGADLKRVGDFPDAERDSVRERLDAEAKAAADAENKAAPAPANKKA